MKHIVLKPLKSKKQLKMVSFQKVLSAGFEDDKEKLFAVTFDAGNGAKQELAIIFETRTPRVFVSDIYND